MKRTRIILAGILLSVWTLPAAAGNDRPIVVGELPAAAREFLRTNPTMILFPGICIILASLSMNLIGDGLRDALDPRLKS